MVLGQIGEHAHRKADAPHPLEKQRVGRHLHDHMGAARVRHAPEQALELKGFRGCALRGQDLAADHVLIGADQPHLRPQTLLQDILEKIGSGGFAVGAGDARQRHAGGGVAVPVPAHLGQRGAAVRRAHIGNPRLRLLLAEHARRALLHSHGDKPVAVRLVARHGNKESAGLRLPGIIADAGNLHRQVRVGLQDVHALQQFA